MGKNRLNITLNLDMGKQEVSAPRSDGNSILARELNGMKRGMVRLSKKKPQTKIVERIIHKTKQVSGKKGNSMLVRALRSMKKRISGLSNKKPQTKIVERKQKVIERVIHKTRQAPSGNGNSMLVSELRGLRKDISRLPHAEHAGGG